MILPFFSDMLWTLRILRTFNLACVSPVSPESVSTGVQYLFLGTLSCQNPRWAECHLFKGVHLVR